MKKLIVGPFAALLMQLPVLAQQTKGLPDVSSTFRGILALPVPLGNPLYGDVAETVGRLGATVQFPLVSKKSRAFGLGAGFDVTWAGINERALAPEVTSGDIRRTALYGRVLYESYTSKSTFYELSLKVGSGTYAYACSTCGDSQESGLLWGLGFGYFIHASENLAFGLTMGYERVGVRLDASDMGLETFPGRSELSEARDYQDLVFGLIFSTRLRKAPDAGRGW
jgi:hypothetical protein